MAVRSIQNRLLALGLAIVFAVGAGTTWFGYWRAVHEVDELVDAQLAQYAQILLALTRAGDRAEIAFPAMHGHNERTRIVFQVWETEDGAAMLTLTSPGLSRQWPERVAKDGYSNARIGDQSWRCFAATDEQGEHRVWVALSLHDRNQLTGAIALNNVKSYALGLPVLAVLLAVAIRRGLVPLRRMESELGDRSPERLDPLSEDETAQELRPLIRTMNALFRRVVRALDNERRFTSDAAHELRTPLAALKVQLQVAQRTPDIDAKQAALGKAMRGAERMTRLVEQLLSLARLESGAARFDMEPFDLSALVEDLVSEMKPAAGEKDCELAADLEPERIVYGKPDLIAILLRNLVDNALRYSPGRGKVVIRLSDEPGHIVLAVLDDGPGVAAADRGRLGERFQRFAAQNVEGVGLGLSIVLRIAELHGTTVAFGNGLDSRGLGVTLQLRKPQGS